MSWLDIYKNDVVWYYSVYDTIERLTRASRALKRFEENILHEKLRLKMVIKAVNSGGSLKEDGLKFQNMDTLRCYLYLIESNVRCKNFQDALKLFKKIKLFKLDSINPDDVEHSLVEFGEKHVSEGDK